MYAVQLICTNVLLFFIWIMFIHRNVLLLYLKNLFYRYNKNRAHKCRNTRPNSFFRIKVITQALQKFWNERMINPKNRGKSWLFLKCLQGAFCKGFGSKNFMFDWLSWRLPESLGWPKKCKTSKFYRITWLFILIKTSNQKILGVKKFIYLPRMSIRKENLKSKLKKLGMNKAYILVAP